MKEREKRMDTSSLVIDPNIWSKPGMGGIPDLSDRRYGGDFWMCGALAHDGALVYVACDEETREPYVGVFANDEDEESDFDLVLSTEGPNEWAIIERYLPRQRWPEEKMADPLMSTMIDQSLSAMEHDYPRAYSWYEEDEWVDER